MDDDLNQVAKKGDDCSTDQNGTREAHDRRDDYKTLTEDLMRQLERLGHRDGALLLSASPVLTGMSEFPLLSPFFSTVHIFVPFFCTLRVCAYAADWQKRTVDAQLGSLGRTSIMSTPVLSAYSSREYLRSGNA
jgi:hypothetical protein